MVVVSDIVRVGAFKEAVKDVNVIKHAASLLAVNIVNPQGYIKPAIQGALGILQSAVNHVPGVKCIVIPSPLRSNHGTRAQGVNLLRRAVKGVEKNGVDSSTYVANFEDPRRESRMGVLRGKQCNLGVDGDQPAIYFQGEFFAILKITSIVTCTRFTLATDL